jgi:hypothetical protein
MVMVACSVIAFAALVFASDGDPGGPGRPPVLGSPSGPATRSARPGLFTTLPPPCGTVHRATLNRLVPKATTRHSANTTLTTCTFTAPGARSPSVRVEARIFLPTDGTGAVEAAGDFFTAQWTRARSDPAVRTVSLRRYAGLGDEAYRRYTIDKSGPAATGEVAVRLRNAVITVSYEKGALSAGEAAADGRVFLAAATEVAREVTGAFK